MNVKNPIYRFIRKTKKLIFDLRREQIRNRKLKKSQRHIFVDCGANTTQALRSFIKKFPSFEFFAFEPQPNLAVEGRKVIEDHPNTQITFYNKAVWIKNESLNFYLATEWGENYKGGSTLVAGHTQNNSKIDYSKPVKVDAIDFSSWLKTNFSEDDYVLVKMDIEGAEYEVIDKIIKDGNEGIIDELIVEFHQHMNNGISKERHDSLVEKIRGFALLEIWH